MALIELRGSKLVEALDFEFVRPKKNNSSILLRIYAYMRCVHIYIYARIYAYMCTYVHICTRNRQMEHALEDVVAEWESLGYGLWCGTEGRIIHLIWADNIWLIAGSRIEREIMQTDLNRAIEKKDLEWKPASLLVMSIGEPMGDMMTE